MKRLSHLLAAVIVAGLIGAASGRAAEEPGFKLIIDGQSLSGWKGEEGFWRVENGAIVGESTAERPLNHNTFLLWDQGELDDFELRLEFRLTSSNEGAANSGIQFRSGIKPDGHVFGYQADLDVVGNWVGACYDELGRGVLAKRGEKTTISENGEKKTESIGDAAELLKKVKKGDWNEYTVVAQGNRLTLKVNGNVTAEIVDGQTSERELAGVLALQLHSGPPQKVEFRNIRLKRLPLSDGRKKVVFIAGRPSHGPLAHEHNAGCLLLAKRVNDAAKEHGMPLLATVYRSGWPSDPTALDNADTVVSYCDGGGGHYLNDRLEDFNHLVETRGIGLVCIHYGVEVPKGPSGEHFLKWIGGYFEPHWSVNPHWTANYKKFPDHPIARGVKPFEINDEWYYHMRFPEGMQGVTPILTDLPPRESLSRDDGPHSGNPFVREAVLQKMEPQHMAWAFERPGGKGRGFGFTGAHNHQNWQHDDFRKVVLNAIVWSTGLEVPAGGVPSATPSDEEMASNLDPKGERAQASGGRQPAGEVRTRDRGERGRGGAGAREGGDGPKPLFSSPVVNPQTAGHAVEIDVDVTRAKTLFLAVTDGRDGFGCDWADWAEPRLVGPDGEKKLTELKWKSATADWGQARVNKNADGAALQINGKPVEYGIGTHANSLIEFELPADHKFTRFKARGGLDNGGTNQGCGSTVQFHVFNARPGGDFLARVSAGAGPVAASHESSAALAQLDVHPDLTATLFAAEPMLLNPTDIDIDHLGRVWVCEVINYRRFANKDHEEREAGDCILILEDTDGDGTADKGTTFYQGRDIDSAHGICVLPTPSGKGTRAIVSAGDSVFVFTDDDGDLMADRKDVLFTGIDGKQHDHGIHAFVFGPDGKLYFNYGNAGKRIKDKHGKPIVDKAGNEVNDDRRPYQEGMVFRCNMDGSEFETVGWNFRNNWEVAVDSFGTLWQSDNDDDGNRGVRINYVMEYGNFGYKDEFTGAGWQSPRTGWEEEIPLRHWHLNDPGVVPNLLQTGAGSPTGILVYEGDSLPEVFRGQVIHCDAGPNIVRAYPAKKSGAGYTAETVNILDGAARNQWFRPSDVCTAPDGSLIVADWYDPGVGGHRMQDVQHGRLFRVTAKEESGVRSQESGGAGRYVAPKVDVSSPEGAIEALKSPNLAVRYMGWTALHAMGEKAVPALVKLYESDNPRFRARALWLLGKLNLPKEKTLEYLRRGLTDKDDDIRVTAVRLARQLLGKTIDVSDVVKAVNLRDPSPAVRREVLIALRELPADCADVPGAWAQLASQHDGQDRWYLEALGIGAQPRWDECLAAWRSMAGADWKGTKAGRDIVWRSRATQTPELLAQLVTGPGTPETELPRYFRAFDFQQGPQKDDALLLLAFAEYAPGQARGSLTQAEAIARLKGFDLNAKPEYRAALTRVLDSSKGTLQYVRLVDKFAVADRYADLLKIAQERPSEQVAVEALRALFGKQQRTLIRDALSGPDRARVEATLAALGTAEDNRSVELLMDVANDGQRAIDVRRSAVKALGNMRTGAVALQKLAEGGKYDPAVKEALASTLHTVQWRDVKEQAAKLFPLPPGRDSEPLPPLQELLERKGDVAKGRIVFHTTGTCAQCHIVNGIGKEVGPNLSEIGKKLAKPAFFESILYPSAAISHNYETWTVLTSDGNVISGVLVSETPDELQLKDEKALLRTVKKNEIEDRKKVDVSLMPADLQKVLSAQDLVDVVEYMGTLKEAQATGAASK